MSEARFTRPDDEYQLRAAATVGAYEVIQLPGGEAAFLDSATAVSTDAYTDDLRTRGKATVAKVAGVVLLAGQEVYWDHSANAVTYRKVNDRDFLVGTMAEDATGAVTTCVVDLNKRCRPTADLLNGDGFKSVLVGTAAAGGLSYPVSLGGALVFELTATNEAQKVDALSVDGFSTVANAVIEYVFRVISDGSAGAQDVSIGVANATHASDADSITESLFIHLNGGSTTIYAESDDGTTEVAATDTTTTYSEGSEVANRVHVLFDMRDPGDVQIYVNGALVLGSTTFDVDAATGPWFLLVHVEKTASTDTYKLAIDRARAWTSEQ